MNRLFLLVGIGVVLAGAGAVAVFCCRGGRAGHRAAYSLSCAVLGLAAEDLLARLDNLALLQVGHSRRIAETLRDSRCLHLFRYVCETGFEHRRQSHSWLVAAFEKNHACSRATITAQDWLIAAATAPACRELLLTGADEAGSRAAASAVAIVEDADEWNARLRKNLSRWFNAQPPERSWEIVPGFVVGYQTGLRSDEALADLGRAAEELATLLAE